MPRMSHYDQQDPTPPPGATLHSAKVEDRQVYVHSDGSFGCFDERKGAGWVWRSSLAALKKELAKRTEAVEVMCVGALSSPPTEYGGYMRSGALLDHYKRYKLTRYERNKWRNDVGLAISYLNTPLAVDEALERELMALQREYIALEERWDRLIETRGRPLDSDVSTGAPRFLDPAAERKGVAR